MIDVSMNFVIHPNLFSIIMPTYNRENLIVHSLDSVHAQTYRPVEIIIVDDGSIDNTAHVVDDWRRANEEQKGFHVKYVYQKNAGPSAARNRGLIECRGEFIQFLDSDDLIPPQRLETLAKVFQDPECDFIQTGFNGFCANCGEIIENHYGKPDQNQLEVALKGRLWPNTLRSAFRHSLIASMGPWNEEMTCFEDYEYVIRALLKSHKSIAIRDILASALRGGDMRITDRLRTREGRVFRIHCEQVLCEGIKQRNDIPLATKKEFASRLYALGFRSNARGWQDLGNRCGELAESIGVDLDMLGKRRRMVWRLGKWAGIAYGLGHWLKEYILFNHKKVKIKHKCPRS